MRMIAIGAAVAAIALAASPALALNFINDQDQPVRIIIEKWVQILNGRSTASFNPSSNPVEFRAEFPTFLILCSAAPGDEVRFADNSCYVNGELAAPGQFRM